MITGPICRCGVIKMPIDYIMIAYAVGMGAMVVVVNYLVDKMFKVEA